MTTAEGFENDPRSLAIEHYTRRSAAFYRAMTEGAPEDGTPLLGQPGAAGEALDELTRLAHRLLGKAAESEAFERRP